jgi:hypothetical protein
MNGGDSTPDRTHHDIVPSRRQQYETRPFLTSHAILGATVAGKMIWIALRFDGLGVFFVERRQSWSVEKY